eukprot:366560-Chlamydomonas_euryale.AAC.8
MSAGWTCLPHAGLPARIVRPLNARGRAFQARPGNGAGTPVGTPLGSAVMAACRCPCRRALSAQVSWQGADALDGALIVAVVGQLEQLWVDGLAFHIRGGVKDSLNLGPLRVCMVCVCVGGRASRCETWADGWHGTDEKVSISNKRRSRRRLDGPGGTLNTVAQ